MKISIPLTLAIACLFISIALMIITFILDGWIEVKSSLNRYGMWRACLAYSSQCSSWYDNAETLVNYKIDNFFKAFQGLQTCMLGLEFVTLVSLLLNSKLCAKMFIIFVIDNLLVFVAWSCGLASLIIFGVKVHNPNINNLAWCYWVSLTALVLDFLALIFLALFTYQLGWDSNDSLDASLNKSEEYPKVEPTDLFKPEEPQKPQVNFDESSFYKSNTNENNINNVPNLPSNNNNFMYPSDSDNNNTSNNRTTTSPSESEKKPSKTPISSSPRFRRIDPNDVSEESDHSIPQKNRSPRFIPLSPRIPHERPYKHEHYEEKKPRQEQYRPGYTAEPDQIEYSLERSWVNSSNNNFNNSMPTIPDVPSEAEGLTGTFNSRHFVKIPRLIYYDGSNHYTKVDDKD